MTTRGMGEEGFRWFVGVVEDRDDPSKTGRVRVRVYGVHDQDKVVVPKESLPWAAVLLPAISPSIQQVGISATGLMVGSTVIGFFLDGNETNIPVILGSLPGKDDMSQLAKGRQTLNKQPGQYEPTSAYRAQYPYNKVTETESGHVFEVDDTPNFERLHTYHRSGTYEEIASNGTRVKKIVGDNWEIVEKDQTVFISGTVNIKVQGNYNLDVDGTIRINGEKIILNEGTKGAARLGDTVPDSETDGPQGIGTSSSSVLIGD